MSAVDQLGGKPLHHTNVRSTSHGPALTSKHAGAAASFADATRVAARHLANWHGGQSTTGNSAATAASHAAAATASNLGHGTTTLAASHAAGASVAAAYGRYIGRSAGSGQCVALVYAVNPTISPTATWTRGESVRGNTSLQPGTVIATFNKSGRYANATDGSSHTAIYLGQNERGIQVLDQWAGSSAAVRTIRWTNSSGIAADTGSAFYVVQTGQTSFAQVAGQPAASQPTAKS